MADLRAFNLATVLKSGSHALPSDGSCTMEVAVLAAGFGWTMVNSASDLPACMCRVIGSYVIRLNDALRDHPRQELLAFVPRLTATAGDKGVRRARARHLLETAGRHAAALDLRTYGFDNLSRVVANESEFPDLRNLDRSSTRVARSVAFAARVLDEEPLQAAIWIGDAVARTRLEWSGEAGWRPFIDALDGALRIGPQSPPTETATIRERVRILEGAA